MISIKIKDTKNFMQQLLMTESFDSYLAQEATITTFNTFHIDGRIMKDFFTAEELELAPEKSLKFSLWKEIRPICFQLIKGKKTPLGFHFIFQLPESSSYQLLAAEDCTVPKEAFQAFVLNIKYDGNHVTCITATALKTFLPDKSADQLWDKAFCRFLDQHAIAYESE